MSKPDHRITLPCDLVTGDVLEVTRTFDEEDSDQPFGIRILRIGDQLGSVYFSKESARKLFNWLGVELHK